MIIELFKNIYLNLLIVIKKFGLFKLPKNSLRVLMYHNISEENFENFEKQILYLKKNWKFISPRKFKSIIKKKNHINGRNLLITFDDGFKSNYLIAKKILKKYKIKGIFFIPLKFILLKNTKQKINFIKNNLKLNQISKDMANMDLNDLKYLNKNGHEIGSHTYSHKNLKNIRNKNILKNEIYKKNQLLEKKVNIKFKSFAFNFGTIAFISEASLIISSKIYENVFVAIRGENKSNNKLIYRDNVNSYENPKKLELYLSGVFDSIYKKQRKDLEDMLTK